MDLANRLDYLAPLFQHYELDDWLIAFNQHIGRHHLQMDGNERYHHTLHAYVTALNCYEGAVHSRMGTIQRSTIRNLMLAGLFHDFQHSHGLDTDMVNIHRAIEGVRWVNGTLKNQHLGEGDIGQVCALIGVTMYPHIGDPKNVAQGIIRDADMMASYQRSPHALQELFVGLWREVNIAQTRKGEALLTWDQFLEAQQKFADVQFSQWYTDWGRRKSQGWYKAPAFAMHHLRSLNPYRK